ncbi:hypothetical protein OBBRIDRAFT_321223 [Obba rivulosa]|uniref:Uncharacterized protein n=1 Tax=Obba rivulosa TaxID=1052685 RepID=A0A8E2ANP6_9APHY|nr:hypothetical protein OBBRIDRAFT_321223 [Obba rivulosa]
MRARSLTLQCPAGELVLQRALPHAVQQAHARRAAAGRRATAQRERCCTWLCCRPQATMALHDVGKGTASVVSGLATGGTISQKSVRDTLPPMAYDPDRSTSLHVVIVNVPHSPLIMDLPAPARPVLASMYLDVKLS